jgi:hypothetical protein
MAKREDLELQRCTAPKRSEECSQKGGQQVPARESKENSQLPVYQSDPIVRELQVHHVKCRPSRDLRILRRHSAHSVLMNQPPIPIAPLLLVFPLTVSNGHGYASRNNAGDT